MQEVGRLHRVLELALDGQIRLGDEGFQRADVRAVAREEGFVGEQEHGVAQMGVEVADEVLGIGNREAVVPGDVHERLGERALAGALAALHHDGDLALLGRVLDHAGHPARK